MPTSLTVDHAPTVNFAMEQAGVAIVHSVTLRNGDEPRGQGALSVQILPDLGDPVIIDVPPLAPGEWFEASAVDLKLPAGRLRSLLEAERGQLVVRYEVGGELIVGCRGARLRRWSGRSARTLEAAAG